MGVEIKVRTWSDEEHKKIDRIIEVLEYIEADITSIGGNKK